VHLRWQLVSTRSSLAGLLAWTLGAAILIFIALEFWRPCYFLTDDNLSGYFPAVTEVGRHLKAGQSPFYSDYLYGGHYNALRDIEYDIWQPQILLLSLLADTPAKFWMLDIDAFLLLMLTVTGFTILAYQLRREFSLKIPDGYVIFYTLSFVFSMYILTIGPSWISFLVTQSCLPWLTLGILEAKTLRGLFLVTIFTILQVLGGYLGLWVSGTLWLSVFALVVALCRHSFRPLFLWGAGNLLAVLVLTPLLLFILDGFSHSRRIHGMDIEDLSAFSVPAPVFLFSFFAGNWTEPCDRWVGDSDLHTLAFPYLLSILACPAAWCVPRALFGGPRWRYLDKLCLGLIAALVLFMIRPHALALLMQHLPVFRSLRWPFREGLLFLFFIHLLLVLRFPEKPARWQPGIATFSLLVFLLPLPFLRVPTFNPLTLDRQLLFSGRAEAFWSRVKATLKPTDEVAAVIDLAYWNSCHKNNQDIPYTLLDTASFPAFFQVRSVSGYSTAAPLDQVPLKDIVPGYWFGAYQETQVGQILAERPHLKLIRIESTHPLKITLSDGAGPPVDLSADLPK
jgi:hypothetical protein